MVDDDVAEAEITMEDHVTGRFRAVFFEPSKGHLERRARVPERIDHLPIFRNRVDMYQ